MPLASLVVNKSDADAPTVEGDVLTVTMVKVVVCAFALSMISHNILTESEKCQNSKQ